MDNYLAVTFFTETIRLTFNFSTITGDAAARGRTAMGDAASRAVPAAVSPARRDREGAKVVQ
jgi:hypothetical protein